MSSGDHEKCHEKTAALFRDALDPLKSWACIWLKTNMEILWSEIIHSFGVGFHHYTATQHYSFSV